MSFTPVTSPRRFPGARRDPHAAILLPGVLATMHLAWAGGFWCSVLA